MITCLFACTASKTSCPETSLQMRRYTHLSAAKAAHNWCAAVQQSSAITKVGGLYKGGYWSLARGVVSNSPWPVRAFVVSAGLGLRGFGDAVPAYTATFTKGNPDLVPDGGSLAGRRAWWRLLGGADRLTEIVRSADGPVLVALPQAYLEVVLPDLIDVDASLEAGRLSVFTSNTAAQKLLGRAAIPLTGAMRHALGGPVGSLTATAVAHAVEHAKAVDELTTACLLERFHAIRSTATKPTYPKRQSRTEDQARAWIVTALSGSNPPTSGSAALRAFRDAGFAYEQKRFGRLFREVQVREVQATRGST